ncbi:putative PC-Esterase [Helianthus anomalus]
MDILLILVFDHVFECRYDANTKFIRLRNLRLAFIHDSIGRNRLESLLCLLSTAIAYKASIYEFNGRPITKHSGFLVFKFIDFTASYDFYKGDFDICFFILE